MWIVKLAWKNLWRNRSRTIITIAAIFFAVILSVSAESLKQGVFENLVRNVVGFYTGYIQVHKTGYQNEQTLENTLLHSAELEKKILHQDGVSAVSPRLESFALIASDEQTKGCMVTGIDPAAENLITSLENKLIDGAYLHPGDHAVLLAEGLAQRLNVQTGDTIVLIGQGYHGVLAAGRYRIKGTLRFGSPELNDKILYMPLPAAQQLFSAGERVSSLVIALNPGAGLNNTAAAVRAGIGAGYEVKTWEEILPDIRQHIATDSKNMKVVQGILYLLICFGIFSTMLMMMLERRYELGMLIAIGMKKTKLVGLLTIESVITVVIGCLGGTAAGLPLVYYLSRHPIRIGGDTAKAYERFGFEPVFPASTDGSIFLYQALIVLIIGLALALYPAIKIMRLDPVKAMKK